MRKCWKWIGLIAGAVAGFAVLFLLASTPPAHFTFTALKPLPKGSATNVPFQLTCSRVFARTYGGDSIEAITAQGTTNYERLELLNPGAGNSNQVVILDVLLPPMTKAFRVQTAYLEESAFFSARWRMRQRHTIAARRLRPVFELLDRLEGDGKYRDVWSPWLVKTNGEWVEQPER